MNITKKILTILSLSFLISSTLLPVAQSGGEPWKWRRGSTIPEVEKGPKALGEYYLIERDEDEQPVVDKKKPLKPKGRVVEVVAKKEKPFSFDFQGYVRLDAFTDSRQSVDFWKGIDYAYPKPIALDPNKRDINDKAQFTMVPFGSVKVIVTGPEVRGAKSSAVIKADIPGKFRSENRLLGVSHNHDPFGMFRYQHGYLNLEWEKTKVLAGVYYSPLVLLELCADTVSINAGEFYDPFQYSGMVRVRHRAEPFEFTFAVHKLFWYRIARDSLAPSLYAQANVNVGEHLLLAGINMDVFTPRLETDPKLAENLVEAAWDETDDTFGSEETKIPTHGYKESESVISFIPFIGAVLKKNNVIWKHRLTYAENPFLYTLIGGAGYCSRNPLTDERTWVKTRSLNYWTDLSHVTQNREIGVFIGYNRSLGSRHKLQNEISTKDTLGYLVERTDTGNPYLFTEGENIDRSFRIQPRVRFFHGPVTIGFEVEYTRVAYGDTNHCGLVDVVTDCTKVANTRVLASVVYSF